jgi:hypothetical protein
MTQTTEPATAPASAEQFAERLFQSALGTAEVLSVFLGDRLGWYRALTEGGPATPAELTVRAGGHERYAREWLEQQASYGILTRSPEGRFGLPDGAAEVLTDEKSLSYLAPLARMFGAAAVQLPALLDAYREGGGVGWSAFGTDMRESQPGRAPGSSTSGRAAGGRASRSRGRTRGPASTRTTWTARRSTWRGATSPRPV